jgi:hypothetical protein
MRVRRLRATPFLLVAVLAAGSSVAGAAASGPRLQLRGDLRIPDGSGVGVARLRDGWIVAGPDLLARLDDSLESVRTSTAVIPPVWRAKGYARLGDVAVAGTSVYVPFEQPDDALNRQVVARFDARTLRFRDAVEIPQRDIAFVAVDARERVAYSMNHLDDDALLRYDMTDRWRPLPSLGLGRVIQRVRGADVASHALWLSTDDARHGVYRVDIRSGVVADLGSAGHLDSVVGGLDATPVGEASLHVMVAAGDEAAVLTGFAVVGEEAPRPGGVGHSGWPPVLVMGVVALVVVGGGASVVLVYRAWLGLRPRPRRT